MINSKFWDELHNLWLTEQKSKIKDFDGIDIRCGEDDEDDDLILYLKKRRSKGGE